MELRDIEIFLALAEELHFGRTAERLHITPSRVSHVIKKQERRIGAPLFERTSRTVRPTEVGEQLYQTLQPAYRQILDGVEEVSTPVLVFVAHQSPVPKSMEETFQPFRTPSGRLIARGPVVTNWDDQLKAVSAGQAVIA